MHESNEFTPVQKFGKGVTFPNETNATKMQQNATEIIKCKMYN